MSTPRTAKILGPAKHPTAKRSPAKSGAAKHHTAKRSKSTGSAHKLNKRSTVADIKSHIAKHKKEYPMLKNVRGNKAEMISALRKHKKHFDGRGATQSGPI